MQVRKQELELDMEQQTSSKLEKEYVKAVYCHPALFNFYAEYIMRNAELEEAQAGIKIAGRNINNLQCLSNDLSWNQDGRRNINNRYTDDITNGRKQRTKEPLDESERGEWKSWLKA